MHDYKSEQAFDSLKLRTTKKHVWSKDKRGGFTDDVIKREKTLKGPHDYSPVRKSKVYGFYGQKTEKGSLLNEVEYCAA